MCINIPVLSEPLGFVSDCECVERYMVSVEVFQSQGERWRRDCRGCHSWGRGPLLWRNRQRLWCQDSFAFYLLKLWGRVDKFLESLSLSCFLYSQDRWVGGIMVFSDMTPGILPSKRYLTSGRWQFSGAFCLILVSNRLTEVWEVLGNRTPELGAQPLGQETSSAGRVHCQRLRDRMLEVSNPVSRV